MLESEREDGGEDEDEDGEQHEDCGGYAQEDSQEPLVRGANAQHFTSSKLRGGIGGSMMPNVRYASVVGCSWPWAALGIACQKQIFQTPLEPVGLQQAQQHNNHAYLLLVQYVDCVIDHDSVCLDASCPSVVQRSHER